MNFILICIVASIGGYIGKKLKIPSGIMIGSMLFVSIFNIIIGGVTYPDALKLCSKILAGVLVGMKIDKSDITNFKKLFKPLLIFVFGIMGYTIVLALLLHIFAGIDIKTALFACTPGGLSDMTLIAESYGANIPQVVLIQTVRLISIICIYPPLCMKVTKNKRNNTIKQVETEKVEVENKAREAIFIFLFAALGSFLAVIINLPAAEVLGAMFFSIIYRFTGRSGYIYPLSRNALQVFVGIMIGSTINYETAVGLISILDVAFISVFFVMGFGLFMGFTLHKLCKLDFASACLGCAPGGVQEMAIIAEDLDVNVSTVTTIQVFRVVMVLSFFPLMIQILMKIIV